MEEKKEDGDSEIQEHGPEHWFSKWERQCLAEAEQREPSEEEADNDQDKLWHLFQNSATAVAQLYKGPHQRFLFACWSNDTYTASVPLACWLATWLLTERYCELTLASVSAEC